MNANKRYIQIFLYLLQIRIKSPARFATQSTSSFVGLQFHLDTTIESIRSLIEYCSGELNDEVYIQSEAELMLHLENLKDLRKYSEMLLDVMETKFSK
jgi:hypothetical protein